MDSRTLVIVRSTEHVARGALNWCAEYYSDVNIQVGGYDWTVLQNGKSHLVSLDRILENLRRNDASAGFQ